MRNSSIDIMKGVGIIAVIIGHCVLPTIIKNFIYSWHMPLFFIISGYFHKSTSIKNTIKKNFYSILAPYLATSLFMVILNFFHDNPYPNIHFHTITAIFVGSGTWGNNISIFETYFVGVLWFLLALFWCRFLYSILEINFSNPYIRGG